MGYYTDFSLETVHRDLGEYLEAAKTISEDLEYIIDGGDERLKWYDVDKDMKKLSEQFPDEVFILSGKGEEQPDLWRAAYQNGKKYTAQTEIIHPAIILPGYTVKEYREVLNR